MKLWALIEFWERREGFGLRAFDTFKEAKNVAERIMEEYGVEQVDREESEGTLYIGHGSSHEVFVEPLNVHLSSKTWSPR